MIEKSVGFVESTFLLWMSVVQSSQFSYPLIFSGKFPSHLLQKEQG